MIYKETYEDHSDAYFGVQWAYPSVEEGEQPTLTWRTDVFDVNDETGEVTLDLPGLGPDAHLEFPFIKHHWKIVYEAPDTYVVSGPRNNSVIFMKPGTNIRKLGNKNKKTQITTTTTISPTTTTTTTTPKPLPILYGLGNCYYSERLYKLGFCAKFLFYPYRSEVVIKYMNEKVSYDIPGNYTWSTIGDGKQSIHFSFEDSATFPFIEPRFYAEHSSKNSTLKIIGSDPRIFETVVPTHSDMCWKYGC